MDIYLKNEKEKKEFHFPVNPIDGLSIQKDRKFTTVDILDYGNADIFLKGNDIEEINFKTLFPVNYHPFCRYVNISSPKDNVRLIEKWKDQKEPIRLIITDFDYNELVTISSFTQEEVAGENGDKYIDITFRRYKEIIVNTVPKKKILDNGSIKSKTNTRKMVVSVKTRLNVRDGPGTSYKIIGKLQNKNEVDVYEIVNGWAKIKYSKSKDGLAYVSSKYLKEKKEPAKLKSREANTSKSSTYTVKNGDNLWKIAKTQLGSGSKWKDIYNIPENKKVIGNNPDLIKPGMKLIIKK